MKLALRRLVRLTFIAGIAVAFCAITLNAEEIRGKFTLPADTFWSGVLVPAGEYTFTVDTNRERPLHLLGKNHNFYALVTYAEQVNSPAKSQILVVNGSHQPMVHFIYLSSVKTAFHFNVPERYEVTTRILSASTERSDIKAIPVTIVGE